MDLIKLIATVADAFLLSTSPPEPEGSKPELAEGETILERPKSASLRWPDASVGNERKRKNKIK